MYLQTEPIFDIEAPTALPEYGKRNTVARQDGKTPYE